MNRPNPKKRLLLLPAMLLLVACGKTGIAENVLQVSEQVTLAGVLHNAAIVDLDVNTLVIDLRTKEEGIQQAEQAIRSAGLQYAHIPIGKDGLAGTQAADYSKLLAENPHKPVLLFCRSGNRAGLLHATYLLNQGEDVDTAISVVTPIVRKEVVAAIRKYAQ